MVSPFRYAIFDLDGTLLDSEPLYAEAAETVCARYGVTFTLDLKRAITGGDTLTGARRVVEALGLPLSPAAYIEAREQELHALWPRMTPMPHAPALIAALRERGIPIALATSGHRAVTQEKLAYQPFLAEIPLCICGDDPRLTRGKPAPDIFLLAARDLAAEPPACVVVEDSVLGVQAGVAAGMHTIALIDPRWGFTPDMYDPLATRVGSLSDIDLDALFG